MSRLLTVFALAIASAATLADPPQQGGSQGPYQGETDGSAQSIERAIGTYLNGNEIKNILTPGEFSEWTLKLKAGQVVIGEVRSETFDPALQIVGKDQKVLASNDDRYPGDQRPLLIWRCDQDGDYGLQVRSYVNKAGGQFFVRFKIYDSVDLSSGQKVEKEINGREPFLLRVPMKAGQMKEVLADFGGNRNFLRFRHVQVIAPNGLPDINLSKPLQEAVNVLLAPVDGDYYILESPAEYREGNAVVRVGTREIVPQKLIATSGQLTGTAPTDVPVIWEVSVKKGELLHVAANNLHLQSKLVVTEVHDTSKYDISKPELNPFAPKPRQAPEQPAFEELPARARDGRMMVFQARRDAKLWIASNGAGPDNQQFTLSIKPAAQEFAADGPNTGKLRIGNTDYWAFHANAGDVMTLDSTAAGFTQELIVRDPDLGAIHHVVAEPDETTEKWRMIVQKPGRYLIAVSCLGDGGGGEYSLSRKVYQAQTFSRQSPAKGEINDGEIQIWKFTAAPNDPLLVHWQSSHWGYDVSIYDAQGRPAGFQREGIDPHNQFGILNVNEPRTYVIVLTGARGKASYAIELKNIPRT